MPNPISAHGSPPRSRSVPAAPTRGSAGPVSERLEGTIKGLQSIQDDSTEAVQKFMTGENEELHTTVLAAEKAELAFDLGLQVRNKVVSAYQEIMRMQM